MGKHEGRLELTWTDKDKALLSTGDGRYDYAFVDPGDWRAAEIRLLHEVGRVHAEAPADRPEGFPAPTTDNLLITGDAMHVLDALAKIPEYAEQYLGKVKLVYIDPPFNTGQAFANYEDNIEHSVWLTMLRDRLRQIKPLLSDDGSVWVHLDHVESHRCRVVLDEEFGEDNFLAEVVWQKIHARNNSARHFSADQDFILVYAKSAEKWRPNRVPRTAKSDGDFWNPDSDPRGLWRRSDMTASKPYVEGHYEVVGPHGDVFKPRAKRPWAASKESFDALLADDRIWWGKTGRSFPFRKRFKTELTGLVPNTVWLHEDVGNNREAKNEISRLLGKDEFATPKPERLLQRIIHIATDPGDVVLDCYAGSGTTAAVAHKMGRRWVTSELLAQTSNACTLPRLTKVVAGEDLGGVSTGTQRVAGDDVVLPDGMSPADAHTFQRRLGQVLGESKEPLLKVQLASELAKTARKLIKDETGPLDETETKMLLKLLRKLGAHGDLDATAAVRSQLNKLTDTREETAILWHGGGGFTHLEVGPSMFVEAAGMLLLADWAMHTALTEVMCAQLSIRYEPDGIFAGRQGRSRYVVIDGMVGSTTVEAIVDRLDADQVVEVWATQAESGAAAALRQLRPGSALHAIPAAVLDGYRRAGVPRSPFGGTTSIKESS